MCKGILTGLAFIHSPCFAHLDLKPANILLDRYGRAKLADFGISGFFGNRSLSDQRAGSLAFMVPDVIQLVSMILSKLMSTAVSFYYLQPAGGNPRWVSETSIALQMKIPMGIFELSAQLGPEFAQAIKDMMNLDPRKRPSAAECLQMQIFADAEMNDGFIAVSGEKNIKTSEPSNDSKNIVQPTASNCAHRLLQISNCPLNTGMRCNRHYPVNLLNSKHLSCYTEISALFQMMT
jgi:serine/threonine protein kinase